MTKNVLLVDDNEQIRNRLTKILSTEGYQVTIANNGLDGFNKMQCQFYDLCIIDHLMPLMDGIQLLKNIDAMESDSPRSVMFLTNQCIDSVTQNPILCVADIIMSKPVQTREFIFNVNDLIEQTAEVA